MESPWYNTIIIQDMVIYEANCILKYSRNLVHKAVNRKQPVLGHASPGFSFGKIRPIEQTPNKMKNAVQQPQSRSPPTVEIVV